MSPVINPGLKNKFPAKEKIYFYALKGCRTTPGAF
jgi:hypothetical protein